MNSSGWPLRELKEMVAEGESERLEFRRSAGQRTEAAKTVCAMLNGLGGFVLFGVSDKGEIIGQQVTAKTLEDIAAEIRRIEPPAFPDIETISIGKEQSVILIGVPGGSGLYTFDNRPFLRLGPTTSVMPRDEFARRLMERLHAHRRWENEPVAEGVSIEDLDGEEIQITLDNAIHLGRLEATDRRDPASVLRGLELIRDGVLLNAAVALYGKSDRLKTLYPQMGIRLAHFRGKNRLADFADNHQYWGHAFALLRRAESFLMDHVPIAGRVVSGKMIREDQPWYPLRATREALANTLCHRDYSIPGGAAAVAMYDDHLEITNPGSLQFGITPEVTPEVRLLKGLKGEMRKQRLQAALDLKDDEHFRKSFLLLALEARLIEMTIPDKPRSRKQKYRLTEKGRKSLKRLNGGIGKSHV